jgi:hypothetical protein
MRIGCCCETVAAGVMCISGSYQPVGNTVGVPAKRLKLSQHESLGRVLISTNLYISLSTTFGQDHSEKELVEGKILMDLEPLFSNHKMSTQGS